MLELKIHKHLIEECVQKNNDVHKEEGSTYRILGIVNDGDIFRLLSENWLFACMYARKTIILGDEVTGMLQKHLQKVVHTPP